MAKILSHHANSMVDSRQVCVGTSVIGLHPMQAVQLSAVELPHSIIIIYYINHGMVDTIIIQRIGNCTAESCTALTLHTCILLALNFALSGPCFMHTHTHTHS